MTFTWATTFIDKNSHLTEIITVMFSSRFDSDVMLAITLSSLISTTSQNWPFNYEFIQPPNLTLALISQNWPEHAYKRLETTSIHISETIFTKQLYVFTINCLHLHREHITERLDQLLYISIETNVREYSTLKLHFNRDLIDRLTLLRNSHNTN